MANLPNISGAEAVLCGPEMRLLRGRHDANARLMPFCGRT